MITKVFEAQI